jgi:tetratricopeptide (TPR) repeat protein
LDPNFVLAWTHLSHKQCDMYWLGLDPTSGRLAAAKDALDHALALDPNLPETHLALGYYRYYAQRDFNGALAEFQLAEKSLPNSVDVLRAIGLLQRRLARWDEAITTFRRAVELDPRNIDISIGLGATCFAVRRFSEVIAVADRILMLDPTNQGALFYKVAAYWAMGDPSAAEPLLANPGAGPELRGVQALLQRRYTAAIEILSKVLSDAPDEDRPSLLLELGLSQQRAGDVVGARATYQQAAQCLHRQLENVAPDSFQEAGLRANLGVAYAGLGEAASAISEGERAMAMDPDSKDPFQGPEKEEAVATIYALLGDADHAIPLLKRLLQTAYGSDSGSPISPGLLRVEPVWDPIRDDPRFQQLATETKQ